MIFPLRNKYGHKDKFLGEGITGRVDLYLKQNEQYAIKTYNAREQYESAKEYHERVSREFKILKDLNHPDIVHVIDFIIKKHKAKLVMEFCPIPVRHLLNSEENKNRYFRQLVDAIEYLHARKICHRDIKLDNLMVDKKDNLKLIDFGDAVAGRTEAMGLVGTGPYVAPEVYASLRYDPFKSDMWSLGIVRYYFDCKEFPWKVAKAHEDVKYADFVEKSYEFNNEILNRLLRVDVLERIDIVNLKSIL